MDAVFRRDVRVACPTRQRHPGAAAPVRALAGTGRDPCTSKQLPPVVFGRPAAAEPSCLPSDPRASSQVHGSRPCMGRLLSRGVTPSFFSFFLRGAFFCSTRAASILPSRPQFPWPSRAGAVKDGAKRHPKGLSLTAPSTAARWRRSGRAAMTFDPRGACEGRATRRRPHLYSVGPLRDPDHEAGIRFACKAPRRRVHSGRGT